jgi:phosphatidylserine/phosphatidylglycerophosphate/cardiolipin synthase-like enzyme
MTPEQAADRVRWLNERHPNALHLARLLSFATLAEPGFIRRMRMTFVPQSSAGDEADVWFSDLVQSRSPNGLMFFPEIAELLRSSVPEPLRVEVWRRTQDLHRGAQRAIQIEEELTYLGLNPDLNRTRIDELLHALISALAGGRSGVANWATRALPRLPAAVRNSELATILGVASDLRTGRSLNIQQSLGALGHIPAWIARVLPALGRVKLAVSWSDRALSLGPVVSSSTLQHTIEVPDTPTIPIEIRAPTMQNVTAPTTMLFVQQNDTVTTELLDTRTLELVTLANEAWVLRRTGIRRRTAAAQIVSIRAYTDGNAVTIHWRAPKTVPGCIGYRLIRRGRSASDVTEPELVDHVLLSRPAPPATAQDDSRATDHLAIQQTFRWIDRHPRTGAEFSYRVIPLLGNLGRFTLDEASASSWTAFVRVGPQRDSAVSVAFNRTLSSVAQLSVSAEEVADIVQSGFLEGLAAPGNSLRKALGGDLLETLIGLLTQALASASSVYVAMFELDDVQLLQILGQFGSRANVILSNGNAAKRGADRNLQQRTILRASGVNVIDRFLKWGRLAHNKFVVVCNSAGSPTTVWTGNVSWLSSALCARDNCAVTIANQQVAQIYLDYWRRLVSDTGSGVSREAGITPVKIQSEPGRAYSTPVTIRPFFTPIVQRADLVYVVSLLQKARQGILYLLSEPSRHGSVLGEIQSRKDIFVQGAARSGPSLSIFVAGELIRLSGKVLTFPLFDGVEKPPQLRFGSTLQTRMILIDPLGSRPIVIVGSHSFGETGSRVNDENFVVIEGDTELARRCAAHVEIFCRHFLTRRERTVRDRLLDLMDSDAWQRSWFSAARKQDLDFWMGEDAGSVPASEPVVHSSAATQVKQQVNSQREAPRNPRRPASKKTVTRKVRSKKTTPAKASAVKRSKSTVNAQKSRRPRPASQPRAAATPPRPQARKKAIKRK